MAKLQIFVLALILAQGYCVSLTNLPSSVIPQTSEQPLCVTYVKLILQSIIDKLGNLPAIPQPEVIPQPEFSPELPPLEPELDIPEVITPQDPKPEESAPEVEETKPEVNKTPCTACFKYLTTLITSAQKAAAARRQPIIALY